MFMKNLLARFARWWKQFVKEHLIDEVDPNDPNF